MEDQVELALTGFHIFEGYALSEKISNELIAEQYNVPSLLSLKFIQTGSFAEGFPDPVLSDVDWMVILNDAEKITCEWQSKLFKTNEQAPAHLEMIIPQSFLQEFKETFCVISDFISILQTDNEGKTFISPERMRIINVNDFLLEGHDIEKPSAPWDSKSDDTKSPAYCLKSNVNESVTCDRVPALLCEDWPEAANEWVTRKPRYWPSDLMVEKIAKNGFALVAKPSSKNADVDKEWRLSFSTSEAQLFQSFNVCQRKVYYLLRSIYIRYLKERVNGIITSYNIKTIMFWMLQDKEPAFWCEENVGEIILSIFKSLHKCLKDGFCPHFFLPKHNLLYNVKSTEISSAVSEIATVLRDLEAVLIDISMEGFLGLLPRFGFFTIQTQTRVTQKLLQLPQTQAYHALVSKSETNIKRCENVWNECFAEILGEASNALRSRPDADCFVEVNLPVIFQGYHLARAITKQESKLSLDKSKMLQVDPKFMEICVTEVNRFVLFWMDMFKLSLLRSLENQDKRFLKLFDVVNLLKFTSSTDFVESDVYSELSAFHVICSTTAGFNISQDAAKGNSLSGLLDIIEEHLSTSGESKDTKIHFDERSLFALVGGTYEMSKRQQVK